jgi:hypothetical protein
MCADLLPLVYQMLAQRAACIQLQSQEPSAPGRRGGAEGASGGRATMSAARAGAVAVSGALAGAGEQQSQLQSQLQQEEWEGQNRPLPRHQQPQQPPLPPGEQQGTGADAQAQAQAGAEGSGQSQSKGHPHPHTHTHTHSTTRGEQHAHAEGQGQGHGRGQGKGEKADLTAAKAGEAYRPGSGYKAVPLRRKKPQQEVRGCSGSTGHHDDVARPFSASPQERDVAWHTHGLSSYCTRIGLTAVCVCAAGGLEGEGGSRPLSISVAGLEP